MKILSTVSSIREELQISSDRSLGLVPTMGYLHEGHISLVRQSLADNHLTVVSIFVNPTQFGPSEDFNRYPRDLARDLEILENLEVDYVFAPDAGEMYAPDHLTTVQVSDLEGQLCGASRPGHFRGVTTVVLKLFNIIRPRRAYFGQKDAQQAVIIKKMRDDLNLDVEIRVLPIVRAADGLALSSRNSYLSEEERAAAIRLPRALTLAGAMIRKGELQADAVTGLIEEELKQDSRITIEYVQAVDLKSLQARQRIDPGRTLIAAAIRIGRTRLIDNIVLGEITC